MGSNITLPYNDDDDNYNADGDDDVYNFDENDDVVDEDDDDDHDEVFVNILPMFANFH